MTTAAAAQPRRVDALLGWMDGLAEPTRLRLLRALERRELSVLELCEVLAAPQSTVSRHLKALTEAGFLQSRRQATLSLYAWAEGAAPAARKLWTLARSETDGWAAARHDAKRLEAVLARRDDARRFFAG